MRASRKVNRGHIRSPSPDIANRSIITQTTPPDMREVLNKSRSKISQTTRYNIPNTVEELQIALQESQQKYRELQKQLTELLFQNSGLKRQLIQLKNISSKNKPSFSQHPNEQHPETNLKKYEAIISNMSEEIRRIQDLLGKQKQKNEYLQSQNHSLKNKEPVFSAHYSRYSQRNEIPYRSLCSIEQTLQDSFERYRNQHDLKIHLSLNAVNERLIRVQKNQAALQSRISISDYRTPKVTKQNEKYEFSTGGYNSSGDAKKYNEVQRYQYEQREKDMNTLRKYQSEIQNLKKQILGLNNQLQRQKERSLISECPKCNRYLAKIDELQSQIEHLKLLRGKSKIYLEKIEYLQRENEELRSLREQNKFYLNRLEELQNENKKIKQLRQQEQYQKEMNNRLDRQRSQNNMIQNLEDYLRRIKDVKNILGNQQFRQFLQRVDHLVIENTNLQAKLDQLLLQKQRQNRQSRRQLELKKQVNQLTRQNNKLKYQVQELQEQCKKLMQQMQEYMRTHTENTNTHYSSRIEHLEPDTLKFKNYLGEAIKRLQSVQQSITKTITRN